MFGAEETTHRTAAESGFGRRELSIVGLAALFVGLNVGLMWLLAATPLAAVNDYLFSVPIVGLLVYGAGLTIGRWLANRGVRNDSPATATVGMAVLQLAFGAFGAGVLATAPPELRLPALGAAAVLTVAMTLLIGAYVYARNKEFDRWSTWGLVCVVGAVATGIAGTFYPPALLATFALVLLSFAFYFGWEIWRVKRRRASPYVHAIGVYVAFMGLFVHVLQIVLRLFGRRR